MSQISKKSITQQVTDTVRERYSRFQEAQEIYLDDKEYKALIKEINLRNSNGTKFKGDNPITFKTSHGTVKISNRDNVENFANREQY